MHTEINGHKFEIEEQIAKRIDLLHVGDRVRVLVKNAYTDHKIRTGVVIGFEPFPTLPSVLVAYIDNTEWGETPKVVVKSFNAQTKDLELVIAGGHTDAMDFDQACDLLQTRVDKAYNEWSSAKEQRDFFIDAWKNRTRATAVQA